MNVKLRQTIERKIIRKIVTDAVKAGYTISVFDCEEWTVKRSQDITKIMRAIMTTDDDTLAFRDADGTPVGKVWLVYGNDGYDVVCDYTANEKTETLLAGGLALAEKLEEKHG